MLEQVREERDFDAAEMRPVSLSMPVLTEVRAKWLVEMGEYLSDNPRFITNGFRRAGIIGVIAGEDDSASENDLPIVTANQIQVIVKVNRETVKIT